MMCFQRQGGGVFYELLRLYGAAVCVRFVVRVRTTCFIPLSPLTSPSMMFSGGHAAKFVLLAAGQAIRASAECAYRVGESRSVVGKGRKMLATISKERFLIDG